MKSNRHYNIVLNKSSTSAIHKKQCITLSKSPEVHYARSPSCSDSVNLKPLPVDDFHYSHKTNNNYVQLLYKCSTNKHIKDQ